MKKYDKVVRHRVGSFYIKDVERSYFASSDVVQKSPLSFFILFSFPNERILFIAKNLQGQRKPKTELDMCLMC